MKGSTASPKKGSIVPTAKPPRNYRANSERVSESQPQRVVPPPRMRRAGGGGCGSALIGLMFALLLAAVVTSVLADRFSQATEQIVMPDPRHQPAEQESGSTTVPANMPNTLQQPFTVLLVGVDKRSVPEDDSVRSDTLIVVHVNPYEGWASMLSIPRDSVAKIPYLGMHKINAAYTYGYANATDLYRKDTEPDAAGAALAAETVERFLGLKIDYIAQVDFGGFEEIVNTLGGITVDVTQPVLDAEYPTENFGFERIYIPVGLQVFDGQVALRYARSRHSGTDFDRSRRQQQVLRALLREVQRRGLLNQVELLPSLVETLEQNVATTMPVSELAVLRSLAQLAKKIQTENILQLSINPYDVAVLKEQGSDIYWDEEDIALLVDRMLTGPKGENEVARVQVQNGIKVTGLATQVTNILSAEGFDMAEAADAPGMYEYTMIVDYTGRPETRKRLTNLMGISSEFVFDSPPPEAPPLPFDADIVVVLGQDYQDYWSFTLE